MASGLPVAAPNSGGVLSYASTKNAWLCNADATSFAAAIVDIFQNDEERGKRVENALRTALKYDWETSTDRLFALYDRMFEEFDLNRPAFDREPPAAEIDLSKESISHA